MVKAGLDWREHSFFEHPSAAAIGAGQEPVRVRVGDPPAQNSQINTLSRDMWVSAGTTLGEVVRFVASHEYAKSASVLTIDADEMSNLCRCVADLPEVHELNTKLPQALAMPYSYCDTSDNPYFVECRGQRRSGCRKHPVYLMNVSRSQQRPPQVPASACGRGFGCGQVELPTSHITMGVIGKQ